MIARPSLVAAFFASLLALAGSRCSASTVIPSGTVALEYVTGGVKVIDGVGDSAFIGRTFSAPAAGMQGAQLAETYGMRVGGNAITAVATRAVTAAAIANAAVAVGGAAWAGWQVGSAIAEALELGPNDPGPSRCVPGPDGWKCDAGNTPSERSAWVVEGHDSAGSPFKFSADSAGQACSQVANRVPQGDWSAANVQVTFVETGKFNCAFMLVHPLGYESPRSYPVVAGMSQFCPASIDALNPAWSVAEGEPPGADGKCRSGRYNTTEPAAVSDRLRDHVSPDKFRKLAEAVLDKGGTIQADGPRKMSGPTSITGQPQTSTTTGPDGKVTTTTRTPSTNYTYDGNKITYNTSYRTEINNDGDVTIIEENTPAQPGETDCEKFPDAIGCSKYGEPPTDQPPWEDKEIPFEPVDLGVSGSCPAPTTWTLPRSGYTMTWSYAPACEVAPVVRAGLLIITAMGCMIFIVGTVRT